MIREKFCVKCGKKIVKGILCDKCNVTKEENKTKKVKVCSKCGAYYYKNKKVSIDSLSGNVILSKFLCNECQPKPFKVKVQLRGFEPGISGFEKNIRAVIRLKEGVDLEFISNKAAEEFVRKIKKNYAVNITRTRSLITQRKDGKKIYRQTILVRFKNS